MERVKVRSMDSTPICFILLTYDPNNHRHWVYLYRFIEKLGSRRRVAVIIEQALGNPPAKNVERVYVPSARKKRLRSLQIFFYLIRLRLAGYKVFYNHYTFGPCRQSALITRLTGGRTYLWHCIPVKDLDFFTRSSKVQQWLFKATLRIIHYLVTGSSYMAGYYQQHFNLPPSKTIVVPNYIDINRFNASDYPKEEARRRLELPLDRTIFLYLHEMEPGRSSVLPEIIDEIKKQKPESFFLLVGGGSYRDILESRVARLMDSSSFRFTGSIPNTEVPWYFAAADVYLVTSQFEAFSRTLLEAMAMGVPIASTDGGGFTKAYTPDAYHPYLLPFDRISELASVAVRLSEDVALRETLRNAGLAHVKNYSEEQAMELFEERIR